jgi:hypothetical protein
LVTAVAAAVLLAGCGNARDPGTAAPAPRLPCSAGSDPALITLNDTLPAPAVTVPLGAYLVVTVPQWGWGTATDVDVSGGAILREECTVLLPGGGRRTVFVAVNSGSIYLSATVEPASDLMMPAWGGEVVVRAGGISRVAPAPRRTRPE